MAGDPSSELQRAVCDVEDSGLCVGLARGSHLDRLVAEQVRDERDLFDPETPEDVPLAPEAVGVVADDVEVVELTEVAELEQLAKPADRRRERKPVGDGHASVARAGAANEFVGLRRGQRERGLNEQVLVRVQSRARELVPGRGRRADNDGVQRLVAQELVQAPGDAGGGEDRAQPKLRLRTAVVDVAQLGLGKLLERARGRQPPRAEADDADRDGRPQGSPPAKPEPTSLALAAGGAIGLGTRAILERRPPQAYGTIGEEAPVSGPGRATGARTRGPTAHEGSSNRRALPSSRRKHR